jgi:hypothetical protein
MNIKFPYSIQEYLLMILNIICSDIGYEAIKFTISLGKPDKV